MFYGYQFDGPTIERAGAAASDVRRAEFKVQEMGERVQRLELVCEALWELLKDHHGYTDEQLTGWMAELDLSDGVADGKRAKSGPVDCPQCSRRNSSRHDHCIYCGELLKRAPFG